ncbi:multicopper oxidase-domain-containing protein [Xylaria intraflava]|nr:multicopper oxidase-domain-containing protein [Xylaria intraflava]
MAEDEAGRSLLPNARNPDTQGVRLNDEAYRRNRPDGAQMTGGHLSHDYRDENLVSGQAIPQTRRTGWSLAGFFAVSIVAIFSLSGVLLSFNPLNTVTTTTTTTSTTTPPPPPPPAPTATIEPQVDHESAPPQSFHPYDRYVLDSSWDFLAPRQVREYEWTITDGEGSPDGIQRQMMLINDEFPGPLIEINEGDVLIVNVLNKASNATSLHWHGIFQNGTNWMDGAAGVTQCPIAPGQSYQYKFNVTGQSGTYFYHGHQGVQALDGLVGPMVVHARQEAGTLLLPYASDRIILLQDWYYDQASGIMRDAFSPGMEEAPVPNTALINGVNQAVCSDHPSRNCTEVKATSLPSLQVSPGEQHMLRFLNVGGFAWFQVAVDEHNDLQVVEVDGTIVEPVLSSPLIMSPGQRYSAILKADHQEGAFWLRAQMVMSCLAENKLPENGTNEAKAIVHYSNKVQTRHSDDEKEEEDMDNAQDGDGNVDDPVLPQSVSSMPYVPICRDLSYTTHLRPSPQQSAPLAADHSWNLRVNLGIGDWRLQRGFVNSSSFRPNLKYPTLHRVLDGLVQDNGSFAIEGVNTAAFDESELVISNRKLETVDVILQNMDEKSHPFHLHGAKMWLLGAGHSYFPGYEALGFLPEGKGLLNSSNRTVIGNPIKRDTITVEGFGWSLVRFVADNPGVWLFHCHTIWHSEAGMGMQFLSRLDDLRGLQVPESSRKLCDASEEELRKGAPPKDEVFFGFGVDRHSST